MKALTVAALAAVLVFGTAGSCERPTESYDPAIEVEDCDAEDIKKKDWKDCPHLFQSPRPVRTANQPAPKPTRKR